MDPYILAGLMGTAASIISAIAAPGLRSRIKHAIYGFVIVSIAASGIIFAEQKQKTIEKTKREVEAAQSEIASLKSIQVQAQKILSSTEYLSTTDVGENRGFILSAFSFLETHRERFPESYEIAKKLLLSGLRITESSGSVGSKGYYDEQKRMKDGAAAMRRLLIGISGGENT